MDEIGTIELLEKKHILNKFDCGNELLNSWLQKHALKNQERNNSKTFVLPTISACGNRVLGFYALIGATITHENAIQTLREGCSPKHVIPAILIGRMGIDLKYQRQGIGRALLKDALQRSLNVSRQIGVRAVLVHAKDEQAANFYRRAAGFEPSPTDPLHLLLSIRDIERGAN